MSSERQTNGESHLRSLLKGLTWRFVATGTTMIVAWLTTGDLSLAFSIGGIEFFLKFFVYYVHERVWLLVPLGTFYRSKGEAVSHPGGESRVRSLLKGLSWRCVATGTTMLIAWFLSGNLAVAFTIGKIEFPAKLLAYYLHERAWQFLPRGSIRQRIAERSMAVAGSGVDSKSARD